MEKVYVNLNDTISIVLGTLVSTPILRLEIHFHINTCIVREFSKTKFPGTWINIFAATSESKDWISLLSIA